MTEVQDQTLEGGAGGSEDLNLGQDTTPPAAGSGGAGGGTGSDPLDDIKDPKARDEAKKHRAIARRHDGGGDTPPAPKPAAEDKPQTPAQPQGGGFLTVKDFEKSNEKKAIRIATVDKGVIGPDGQVIATAEEIKENWNGIVSGFTSRRGKQTPEDILEDITDAVILWRGRNPKKPESDDSGRVLSHTAGGGSGGGKPAPKSATPAPSGLQMPVKPQDWFPKKS